MKKLFNYLLLALLMAASCMQAEVIDLSAHYGDAYSEDGNMMIITGPWDVQGVAGQVTWGQVMVATEDPDVSAKWSAQIISGSERFKIYANPSYYEVNPSADVNGGIVSGSTKKYSSQPYPYGFVYVSFDATDLPAVATQYCADLQVTRENGQVATITLCTDVRTGMVITAAQDVVDLGIINIADVGDYSYDMNISYGNLGGNGISGISNNGFISNSQYFTGGNDYEMTNAILTLGISAAGAAELGAHEDIFRLYNPIGSETLLSLTVKYFLTDGELMPEPEGSNYFLKHNWAGGENAWKELVYNEETMMYSLRDIYGGSNFYWKMGSSEEAEILMVNNPDGAVAGDSALFTFFTYGELVITKIGTSEPEPEPVTYTLKVKLPVCAGENIVPVLNGSFGSDAVSLKLVSTDNWYTCTFQDIQPAAEDGYLYFTANGDPGNTVGAEGVMYTKIYSRAAGADTEITINLSSYEWSKCAELQADEDRVRELHMYLPMPAVGDEKPATIRIEYKHLNSTDVEEAITPNWNNNHTVYQVGNYYYCYLKSADRNLHGSTTNTRYFWHLGENIIETEDYFMPSIRLNGIDVIRDLTDVTLKPGETCSLTFEVSSKSVMTEESFNWYVTDPSGVTNRAQDFASFTIDTENNTSTLSFPATLLAAGDYSIWCSFGAKLDGSESKTTKSSTTAHVTVLEGAVLMMKELEETVIEYIDNGLLLKYIPPVEEEEKPETAIALIGHVYVISYDADVVIDARETGIEMGGTVTITPDDDADEDATISISAPKPIYSANETSELILDAVDMTLDCVDEAAGAPRRAEAHAAYMAPRRAQLVEEEHSVISGFASLQLEDCYIASPAGAEYNTEARELMVGSALVRHAVIRAGVAPETPEPDYIRTVTGTIGTICLPKAVAEGNYTGATFYELSYITSDQKTIYFDEVSTLKAGMPYLFMAEQGATELTFFYSGAAVAEAGHKNGLYGSFTQTLVGGDPNNYVIYGGQYCKAGAMTSVGANRAYIKINEVPTEAPSAAPARRISLHNASTDVVTDLESVAETTAPVKFFRDGTIYILRDGHVYLADGQLTK